MRPRRRAPLLLLALWLLAACSAPAAAPAAPAPVGAPPSVAADGGGAAAAALQEVKVGVIAPNAGYWPVYAAEALGYFAREGVQMDLTYTRGPGPSAQLLTTGDLHVAINTSDNAIIAMSKGADFAIVGGAQALALYSLIVTPNVSSFADLRGKLLAIGGPRDGPTTILRRLLRANDLRDDDTEFVAVGGTPERMAAIMSGAVAGSLLAQPYDLMAQANGMPRLAIAADVLPEWQNLNVIVNRPWARANDDLLVRWLRGYIAACAWLNDPANRAEAVHILMDTAQTTEDIAQRNWALYFEERPGAIPADGSVNVAGLRNVVAIAEEAGNFDGSAPPAVERIVDLNYWERARR
jgi:ABC-type nitrate/sulfonate/bicarbonate transport system substrate-binding protein